MHDLSNAILGLFLYIIALVVIITILLKACGFVGGEKTSGSNTSHGPLLRQGTFADDSTIGCRTKGDLYEFYDGATANDVQQLYALVAEGNCYLLVGQSWSMLNDLGSISEVRVYFPQGSKRLFVSSSYMR